MSRKATKDDIPACVGMGLEFFNESGFEAETHFDAVSMRQTLLRLIDNEDGALFVEEVGGELVGMAGAVAYPHYFNARSKAAQELFWWVRPDMRGRPFGMRLLCRLEEWALSRGCSTLTMICLPALDSPAERVYQRTGYRACERSYIKRL